MSAKKSKKPKVTNSQKNGNKKKPEKELIETEKYKADVYIRFVEWTALPTYERDPDTQDQFATKYKISRETLTRWKTDQFYNDVSAIRRAYMRDDFGDIIKALKKGILKRGNGADVKVYAQLAGEMREDNEFTLSPALEGAIAKINKKLPD